MSGKQINTDDLNIEITGDMGSAFNLREVRDKAERKALKNALAVTLGILAKVAELLGITRPTIYDLMKKHRITGID